ncbi:MAG: hypothetical protein NXH75_13055 [Halobacteriovoraceae bacterium]|nr:hypothetical protein [Halobacteriovoraceae bacterium]
MTYQMASKILLELLRLERMGESTRQKTGLTQEDCHREIDQLIGEKLHPKE